MNEDIKLFIVSSDTNHFPNNKNSHFASLLPSEIKLCGNYHLALTETVLPPLHANDTETQVVYIICNLVHPSQVNSKFLNLIKLCAPNRGRSSQNLSFNCRVWFPLQIISFHKIEITFLNQLGKEVIFQDSAVSAVSLLISKQQYQNAA
jgi:hypothetical protein